MLLHDTSYYCITLQLSLPLVHTLSNWSCPLLQLHTHRRTQLSVSIGVPSYSRNIDRQPSHLVEGEKALGTGRDA